MEFEEDALREVAKIAMERKTGARGLRSVIEKTMMDVMYECPSDQSIQKCTITKGAVKGIEPPALEYGEVIVPKKKISKR